MSVERPLKLGRRARRSLSEAIARAEAGHRGEIRVHLEARYPGEGPIARARALYQAFGMERTTGDTAALLYVAWADHKVAVWHGRGLDGAEAPGFWKEVTELAAAGLRRGDAIAGLTAAIEAMGRLMARAAAGRDAADELPNAVTTS